MSAPLEAPDPGLGGAESAVARHSRLQSDEEAQRYHAEGRWGQRLLVDVFDATVARTPDKTAIVEAHRRLSYRELQRQSENLAAALLRLGVRHGDVVAVQAPNWAELPTVHLATNRIGAIFVPLSEGFRERELLHLLAKARVKVLFCPQAFRGFGAAALLAGQRAALPLLQHIVTMRAAAAAGEPGFEAMAQHDGWRATHGAPWLHAQRADADAPSHVMVSSGTTGLPRCSLFSDNNTLVKLLGQYVTAAGVDEHDVAAALAPAGTGATGYNYPILTLLLLGGTSVLLEHWSGKHLDQALALIADHRCTVATVVPAQMAQLVQAGPLPGRDYSALRVVTNAGAKLPPAVAEGMERLFGCTVQGVYGTSEAGATAMTRVDDPVDKRRSTVGRPLDGQELRILDDDDLPVPPGAVGEVCWRGPNKSYGFLNDPAASAAVWGRDGLLDSGDLGRLDDEGYLHIVGRKKDMIIRGGQNVNPGAIEEVLLHHPSVGQVAVVPFADAVLGERIAACVVAKGDKPPALNDLKAFVREQGLAAWHQPELLVLLTELPRNAGGKVDKRALSQLATDASPAVAL